MPKARGRKPVVDVDIQSVGPLVARRIVGDCNVAEIGRVDLIWRGTGKLAPVSKNKSAGKSRPGTLGVKIGGDRGVIETANLVLGDLVVVDRNGQTLDLLGRIDETGGVGLGIGGRQVRVAELIGAALNSDLIGKGSTGTRTAIALQDLERRGVTHCGPKEADNRGRNETLGIRSTDDKTVIHRIPAEAQLRRIRMATRHNLFVAISQIQIHGINAGNVLFGREHRHSDFEENTLGVARTAGKSVGRIEAERETVGKERVHRGSHIFVTGFATEREVDVAGRKLKGLPMEDKLNIAQGSITALEKRRSQGRKRGRVVEARERKKVVDRKVIP